MIMKGGLRADSCQKIPGEKEKAAPNNEALPFDEPLTYRFIFTYFYVTLRFISCIF